MTDRRSRPAWLTPDDPEWRERPPWVMSEMVAAQYGLPAAILAQPSAVRIAAAVSESVRAGTGVVVTGCGTSEHAARAIAALIAGALGEHGGAVVASQAFDAALAPRGGVCIAVSHEGSTGATLAALEAARQAGARTCLITAVASSTAAELVFPTPLRDASWCHSVGYLSPVLAGAAIAGAPPDAGALSAHLAACDEALEGLSEAVGALAGMERLLVVGSGVDAITAEEQALKIEEGAWIPTTGVHLETLLHGHLPAADRRTGLIVFLCDPRARAQRAARTRQVLRAAAAVGVAPLVLASADDRSGPRDPQADGADAAPTVVLPACGPLGPLGALLAGAIALQRVTLALSAKRGTNPDLLRRDDARYRSAALLGGNTSPASALTA